MAKCSDVELLNFFVCNPTYGSLEKEHEKILYFYPPDTDLVKQDTLVGVSMGIAALSRTFSNEDVECIHTQKTHQLLFQAEKNFWFILVVSIPTTKRTKEGETIIEYHDDDIQDTVYSAVLQQAYHMFKFFNGSIESILNKSSLQSLKQRLEHFYSKYLVRLKLGYSDVLDVFNGIHFLPLDKNTYLRIQCFINLLEATFPQVVYTAFLYNDQLVWSGLEQDDMRIMYRYLATALFPQYMEQEFSVSGNRSSTSGPSAHYGKYVLGPPNLEDETNLGKIPRVYVKGANDLQECHLLVYKALSATICLLVNGSSPLSFDLIKKLDKFLGPQMSALASDVSEQYSRKPAPSDSVQFKYIYFNHMNLAQKTTVHSDGKKTANITVPHDILKVIGDLNRDLNHVTAVEDGEIIVKTGTDCWVVGKKSDQREFFVVLNQKNANLIEINEEVKKMCSTAFSNIFFLE